MSNAVQRSRWHVLLESHELGEEAAGASVGACNPRGSVHSAAR